MRKKWSLCPKGEELHAGTLTTVSDAFRVILHSPFPLVIFRKWIPVRVWPLVDEKPIAKVCSVKILEFS